MAARGRRRPGALPRRRRGSRRRREDRAPCVRGRRRCGAAVHLLLQSGRRRGGMTGVQPVVADAVSAATAHLIECQRPDGSWWEWDLPPGPSGAWVTAYVASRLPRDAPGAAAARARAARWLREHEEPGGGWGYNDHTGA